MDKFEYTPKGCQEAITWLKSIGYDAALTRGLSVDGFSIVHAANILYAQLQHESR